MANASAAAVCKKLACSTFISVEAAAAKRTVRPAPASELAVKSASSQTVEKPGSENMREFVSGLAMLSVVWSVFAPFALRANGQIISKAMDERLSKAPPGLTFRLSEGVEGADKRVEQPLANAEPISGSEAGNILNRLPAIKSDPDDKSE